MQREFEAIVGEVKIDVRQQAIRHNKFATTLPQQRHSLLLAVRLMDQSQTRRDFLADGVRVGELYLNDLLQLQNRLQVAEFQYLSSQVNTAIAHSSLLRSVGNLGGSLPIAPEQPAAEQFTQQQDLQQQQYQTP
jgi:hypothetical protein